MLFLLKSILDDNSKHRIMSVDWFTTAGCRIPIPRMWRGGGMLSLTPGIRLLDASSYYRSRCNGRDRCGIGKRADVGLQVGGFGVEDPGAGVIQVPGGGVLLQVYHFHLCRVKRGR